MNNAKPWAMDKPDPQGEGMQTEAKTNGAHAVIEGQVMQEDALAKTQRNWIAPTPDVQMVSWTKERLDIIKTQIVKNPNVPDGAFAYFIEVCKRADLDPLLKQAYLIERKSQNEQGSWVTVWEPQFAEAGLESRADRFPDYGGMKGAAVYEKDVFEIDESAGTVVHKYNPTHDRGQLRGAWAKIDRKGRDVPITWLPFKSRAQYKRDGSLTRFWANDPEGMIRKCARAEQLRLAYPNAFAGMYVEGEFRTAAEHDEIEGNTSSGQDGGQVSEEKGMAGAKERMKAATKKKDEPTAPVEKVGQTNATAQNQATTEPAKQEVKNPIPEGQRVTQKEQPLQTNAPTTTQDTILFGGPDFKGKSIAASATADLEALLKLGNDKLIEVAAKKPNPEPKWVPDVRGNVAVISMELAKRKSSAPQAPEREPGSDDGDIDPP